jgi:hypothetical protein
MGKIITERPRSKSRLPTEKFGKAIAWKGFDEDYTEPRKVSGSQGRTYGWERKEFTDLLGPLKGWVKKQVGRPWNLVYSEVCAVLDKRKLTHKHVLDHLFNWVARTVVLCQDKIWREPEMVGFEWRSPPEFYVHPKNGLLLANKKRKDRDKKKPVEVVKLKDGAEYRKLNGLWYYVRVRALSKEEWAWSPDGRLVREKVEEKRQVGKKELRDLKARIGV